GGFRGGALNLCQIATCRSVGGQRTIEKLSGTIKHHKHIVEIVRAAAGEPAEDFQFLRLANLRFETLGFADVFENRHDAVDGAILGVKRGGIGVDGNTGRVRALAHGLKATNNFSGKNFLKKELMFRSEVRRDDWIGSADGLI